MQEPGVSSVVGVRMRGGSSVDEAIADATSSNAVATTV
jgi:hypothetical protein